jgi:Lon protease-like protein
VRILEELDEGLPFRTARGAVLRDAYRDPLQQGSAHLRETLIEVFKQVAPKKLGVTPAIRKMLREEVTLGALTDIIAYIAPLDPADKQRLLDDTLVERRASQLIGLLRSQEGPANSDSPQPFPPPFSAN